MKSIQKHSGKIIILVVMIFFSYLAFKLYNAPIDGLHEKLVYLMKQEGYIILFAWSILEGEMGLIMAGLLSHTDDMSLPMAIFVAGLGGFAGDQIYFYIGRYVITSYSIHYTKLYDSISKMTKPIFTSARFTHRLYESLTKTTS